MTSIFSPRRFAILATCVAIGSTFAQSPQISAPQTVKPAAIPIEDFVKHAEFESISLSPDGKNMAVIARHRNRANLGIIDLDTRKLNWITNF